jgi:hypothetical protein
VLLQILEHDRDLGVDIVRRLAEFQQIAVSGS